MIYSLSEIDAQCKKATRGAGFEWGHAEEAGKAARWLAKHELPGASLLAAYLPQYANAPEHFQGMCPIAAGAAICDNGDAIVTQAVYFKQLAYPLLLLPYVAMLARERSLNLVISWDGERIVCNSAGICILEQSEPSTDVATDVCCEVSGNKQQVRQGQMAKRTGQFIHESDWQVLAELAHHTYVPASEASRLGAGPAD